MPASTKFRTALRRKSCMTRPEHPAATQAAAQALNRRGAVPLRQHVSRDHTELAFQSDGRDVPQMRRQVRADALELLSLEEPERRCSRLKRATLDPDALESASRPSKDRPAWTHPRESGFGRNRSKSGGTTALFSDVLSILCRWSPARAPEPGDQIFRQQWRSPSPLTRSVTSSTR